MCIVCEIKNKLAISEADAETIGFVLQRVELLARITNSMANFGRAIASGDRIPRRDLMEMAVLASACMSDSIEAAEARNAEMAAMQGKDKAEELFDLIGSLLGIKRRNDAPADGNPGLPPEIWAPLPKGLREMLKGAKVVHADIDNDEDLQRLFDAIKGDGQTKH